MMLGRIRLTGTLKAMTALTDLAPVWSRNVTWMPVGSAFPPYDMVGIPPQHHSLEARRYWDDTARFLEVRAAGPEVSRIPARIPPGNGSGTIPTPIRFVAATAG